MKTILRDVIILVSFSILLVIVVIPDQTRQIPPSPFYAVERDGKWLDYYSVKSNGVHYIKVRWSDAPKDAHRYGAWDSADEDAKAWGGNVVPAPSLPWEVKTDE